MFFGNPLIFANVSTIILKISLFVFSASFPPFRITALDDFIANEEIWLITSGLASKITPITPIGHDTFCRVILSAISFFQRIFPQQIA
jgi:hypothetical protein